MKIAVSFALLAAFTGCKLNSNKPGSSTKDFAANANGPNFAVISAYLPEERLGQPGIDPQGNNSGFIKDLYNWNNLFARKDLGVYTISMYSTTAMNPDTRSTDIIQAFTAIAPQLKADSTIVFTFTGRTSGGKLRLADGLFSFGQLVAPLKGKPGKRFYFLSDAADLKNPTAGSFLIDANASGTKDLSFPEVVEFSAHSRTNSTVVGRLAVEFSGALDGMLRSNPKAKLGEFFKAVIAGTSKNATGPAIYRVSSPGLETETLLSVANLPAKAAAVATPSAIGPMTTPQAGAAAKYTLIEVSMVGCGPCKDLAEEIGGMSLPGCNVKTVIGSGDPEGWKAFAGAAASKHVVSQAENSQYQNKYGISSMQSFPQLLLIDTATDQVVSQDAQGDYASKCGGTGSLGGGIGTYTPPGGGSSGGNVTPGGNGDSSGGGGIFDDSNDSEDEDY